MTVNYGVTNPLIRQTFADAKGIYVVPGFIASDAETGVTTTLGRGGSDYTAALIAAAPNTFDCSGFVYWCLKQVGVNQSYITSYGWRTVGKYKKITSFDSIKKGDIVVVYGHVGIAAGNGEVIDASSSAGEIVYRTMGDWWKNKFVCAWRIFD